MAYRRNHPLRLIGLLRQAGWRRWQLMRDVPEKFKGRACANALLHRQLLVTGCFGEFLGVDDLRIILPDKSSQ